jgi:hypothetical protein
MHGGSARRPDSGERPSTTVAVDLEEFVTLPREHGRLTPNGWAIGARRGISTSWSSLIP